MSKENTILVTGCAGFIGAAVVIGLIKQGYKVLGIDNLNDYYDVSLKKNRLRNIQTQVKLLKAEFKFEQLCITKITK